MLGASGGLQTAETSPKKLLQVFETLEETLDNTAAEISPQKAPKGPRGSWGPRANGYAFVLSTVVLSGGPVTGGSPRGPFVASALPGSLKS